MTVIKHKWGMQYVNVNTWKTILLLAHQTCCHGEVHLWWIDAVVAELYTYIGNQKNICFSLHILSHHIIVLFLPMYYVIHQYFNIVPA